MRIVLFDQILYFLLFLRRNVTLRILVVSWRYQRITQKHFTTSAIDVVRVYITVRLLKETQPKDTKHYTLHAFDELSLSKERSMLALFENLLSQSRILSEFEEKITFDYFPAISFEFFKNVMLQFRQILILIRNLPKDVLLESRSLIIIAESNHP